MVDDRPQARIPDLFLAGAARCGTTAMYLYLKQHPDIYLSVLKEPHFFARDLTLPPQGIRDEASYLALFADARDERRVGEGSVWYLASRSAARQIREFSPTARILVMLRDPVEMIPSLHALYLRTGNEELDLEAAMDAEADRRRGERLPATAYFPEGLLYTEVARYHDKVERFLDVFGKDRVRVVLFEEFLASTGEVYRSILEFLEVDSAFRPELSLARATERVRGEALRQLRRVPPEVRAQMRGAQEKHRSAPRAPLPPRLRARLSRELSGDIERLGRLLGRDLSHWCQSEAVA